MIYFDLETDGLNVETCQIIQIGAVTGEQQFEVKLRFEAREGQAEALALNSYDETAWQNAAIPPGAALARFAAFLSLHATVPKTSAGGREYKVATLAGHNILKFDWPILVRYCALYGCFLPVDFGRVHDTLELAKWLDLPVPDLKLGTLANFFHVAPGGDTHDALVDARTAARVGLGLSYYINTGENRNG